jgi:hypothetical protein
MSRKWPTSACPDEEAALIACLHFAYQRWNQLHPENVEQRPTIFTVLDFLKTLKGDET